MDKIFRSYYKTRQADLNLKKQAEIFKSYAVKLMESRMKLEEEFKALRDASQSIALSEAERESKRIAAQDKYRQLKAKEAELAQYNREKQKQMREEYQRKRDAVVKEIMEAVRKKALLEGYTLILDISGKTLNNLPSVIYASESVDLTDEIITELNRGHEKELEGLKGVSPSSILQKNAGETSGPEDGKNKNNFLIESEKKQDK